MFQAETLLFSGNKLFYIRVRVLLLNMISRLLGQLHGNYYSVRASIRGKVPGLLLDYIHWNLHRSHMFAAKNKDDTKAVFIF